MMTLKDFNIGYRKKTSLLITVEALILCLIFIPMAMYFQLNFSRDFPTYIYIFETLSAGEKLDFSVEKSAEVISSLGIFSPLVIIIIYIVVSFYLKCLVFLKNKNTYLLFLTYMALFFLLWEGTQIRIALAMSFFLIGHHLFEQKKKMFFVFFILAVFFHNSVIFAFLPLLSWKKSLLAVLGGAVAFVLLMASGVLNPETLTLLTDERVMAYINGDELQPTIINSKSIFILILILIVGMNWKRMVLDSFLASAMLWLTLSFGLLFVFPALMSRIVDIFLFLFTFAVVRQLNKDNVIEAIVICLLSFLMIYSSVFSGSIT